MNSYNKAINSGTKSVYVIADRTIYDFPVLFAKVRSALDGGLSLLQYRSKNADPAVMCEEVSKFQVLCREYKVPLIINDRVDIVLEVGADGVHVGRDDMALSKARNMLGEGKIAGATAKTVEQAIEAEQQGASYLGVGALFKSPTKPDAIPVSIDMLKEIRRNVKIPIYGIGGITPENINSEIIRNVDGIAVVSAVLGSANPENAVKELYRLINA